MAAIALLHGWQERMSRCGILRVRLDFKLVN